MISLPLSITMVFVAEVCSHKENGFLYCPILIPNRGLNFKLTYPSLRPASPSPRSYSTVASIVPEAFT